MAGAKSLLPGFNHNVTHQGKQYHVQTEDSGVANPHVITHLFIGGNILASKKSSYAGLVGASDLEEQVKRLMQVQHKEMLRELVRGAYDAVLAERTAHARAFAPGQLDTSAPPPNVAAPAAPAAPAVNAAAPKANGAKPPAAKPAAAQDGWGPPVLPRQQERAVAKPPPLAPAPPPEPGDRRLDELVLSYLAEDLGSKRER